MSAKAELLTRRVLGKAADERAIKRLHEIIPEAEVEVTHGYMQGTLSGEDLRLRYTTVTVSVPGGEVLSNSVICHPSDQYERRKGTHVAFYRLLKDICKRNNEANLAFSVAENG